MYPALAPVMVVHPCEAFAHGRRSFTQVSAGAPNRVLYLHLEVRVYRVIL
jgi:hypothetical protein